MLSWISYLNRLSFLLYVYPCRLINQDLITNQLLLAVFIIFDYDVVDGVGQEILAWSAIGASNYIKMSFIKHGFPKKRTNHGSFVLQGLHY